MSVIIKSYDESWLDSSNVWYNSMSPDTVRDKGVECLAAINDAKTLLDGAEELSSFYVYRTDADIEEHVLNMRRFVFFCNGIHYEISEFVDTPFSVKMSTLAEDIIDLNPSNYQYVKSKFLWNKNYMSLTDLVSTTITDPNLQTSFENMYTDLDEDAVSDALAKSIEEAKFWEEQFELAEKIDDATDEFFTPELREQWPNLTEDERKAYVEEFKNKLGEIYGNGVNMVPNPVTFTETGYGAAYTGDNHIGVAPEFVTDPYGMYSLDKLIDTMTHEMRHRYQDINANDANSVVAKNIRDEWTRPYIGSKVNYHDYYHQPVEEDAKAFAAVAQDDEW